MRVNISDIPHGLPGTLATLRAIFGVIERGQTDPIIVRFTRDAIGRLDFKREREILDRIVEAWTAQVQILEDPIAADWIQEARVTLSERRGDCDDLVGAVGASLEHVGFPVELVVGSQLPGGVDAFSHVWLRAWLPRSREWVSVDPRGILDLGFAIGQELRTESLTAIGSYGWDQDSQTLTDGVSVASTARRRQRNFLMPRLRPRARVRIAGLGNPNAPVETFLTAGSGEATATTTAPIVQVTGARNGVTVQEGVEALGPEAAEKAAKAENISKRLGPWVAGAGIIFAVTGIVRNLRR